MLYHQTFCSISIDHCIIDGDQEEEDKEVNEEDYTSNDDGNTIMYSLEEDAILAGYVDIILYLVMWIITRHAEIIKEQYIGIECGAKSDTQGQCDDECYKTLSPFNHKSNDNLLLF
eukprot:576310_1